MADLAPSRAQEIERSVMKKLSLLLVPFLGLLYAFNMLDRTNVSVAALTMRHDLGFSESVYGLGFGIFYVGYFFFEVPSNIIMEKVGARRWIARIMITWGIISACMLFVRTPLSFYSLRILLGVAEAGFFPGIILYLTYWIPTSLRAQVISRFLALTAILGVFGGPVGGQLLRMNGFHGLAGWQWLFLLEGLPSVLLGFVVLFVMPDGPAQAGWLSPEEKTWITARLAEDGKNDQRVQHLSWKVGLRDSRLWMLILIFIITSIGGNAVGSFVPQMIKARSGGLGADPLIATVYNRIFHESPTKTGAWPDSLAATMLMVPEIVGAVAMVLAAIHSDRTGRRRRHVTLGYLLAGLAYLACVSSPNATWTLFALSLNKLGERTAAGSYWALTTNLLGIRAAAAGIALINSIGNLGGFFGPILMGKLMDQTHGAYAPGLYISGGLVMLGGVLAFFARNHPGANPVESAYVEPQTEALPAEQSLP